jgi:uncharacterized protein
MQIKTTIKTQQKSMRYITICITLQLIAFFLCNAQIPERPDPPRLVNDFANVLKPNEREALEKKLVAYNDSTSTQIAIVTMPNLGGYDAASFSFELAEKWGIGRKNKNNGILILMSVQERDVFIAPGYGIEAYIPDAIAKRIVNQYLIPNFRQGNFYKGFDEATNVMIGLLSGKFTADNMDGNEIPLWLIVLIIVIIVVLIILVNKSGGNSGGHTYTGRGYRPYRGGGPIIWGGGGAPSWGGGSSRGFGGFGGGSFGGAGAGGKW